MLFQLSAMYSTRWALSTPIGDERWQNLYHLQENLSSVSYLWSLIYHWSHLRSTWLGCLAAHWGPFGAGGERGWKFWLKGSFLDRSLIVIWKKYIRWSTAIPTLPDHSSVRYLARDSILTSHGLQRKRRNENNFIASRGEHTDEAWSWNRKLVLSFGW